ncbi:glucan endo-1,3-beta-glucosidase-like [Chenopodium quinoa]|uniref:glucan endo-1,3-beta-glucosidase-like n=1 Tax=Chenopodium quinoa TaxID=63459 RepID=UPI000B793EE0|nr:glucan endo-1,3-beta-glucosidase-like [Chenopodium quinoa]
MLGVNDHNYSSNYVIVCGCWCCVALYIQNGALFQDSFDPFHSDATYCDINLQLHMTSAAIGVNYGFEGDNIPSAYGVIELYMKKHSSLENARAKCRSVNAAKVLGVASPPPAASFSNDAGADMQGIITWLAGTNNPLLINVHPCYVFASNPYKITLDYALFSAKQPIVDGVTRYYSLFEAMVDAVYAASSRVGGSNVAVDQ